MSKIVRIFDFKIEDGKFRLFDLKLIPKVSFDELDITDMTPRPNERENRREALQDGCRRSQL
jgi:hypothetical protein